VDILYDALQKVCGNEGHFYKDVQHFEVALNDTGGNLPQVNDNPEP
jgi:hypothetical protein